MDDNTGKGSQAKKKDGRKKSREVRYLINIFFHILVFQCPICKRPLKAREKMAVHVRSHKLKEPLQCNYPGCNAVRHNFLYES